MNGSDVPGPGGGERTMWMGRPSQWLNFKYFFPGTLLVVAGVLAGTARPEVGVYGYAAAGLVALFLIWKWLVVRCTEMVLTSERLSVRQGVLSRRRHDLELYRVKDTALDEPFLLRLVSLGNIEISSSDRTHPRLVVRAVKDAEPLRQMLRKTVERLRASKGVREVDME
jgi:uncharacterized membrane protein YdbT with pleckstrin-like domain